MFCPKCGQQLADGSQFCGACGSPLNVTVQSDPQDPKTGQDGQPAGNTSDKKKFPLKVLIIAAAAVVVVVVAVIVLVSVLGKSKSADNAYVYLSDGSYEYIANLSKGTSVEISSSKSSDISSNLVRFSSDGTYVYYFTKYDSSTGTGTLCRAQYAKLKDGSGKNDDYIETIATNVYIGFSMLNDDIIIYKTGDDTLYCYDGESTQSIAKDVSGYYSDDGERLMYYTVDQSDYTYIVYGLSLDDPDNAIRLADNVEWFYSYVDLDNIFYCTYDADEKEMLYVVGMDGESVCLGTDPSFVYSSSGTYYFTVESGETISLYDYVIDDYAESDSSITEPDLEDYVITDYDFDRLYYDDDNSEVTEYYTSCTNAIAFYSSGWFYRSMEYAAENDDELGEYFQTFVDKYLEQEDVYGYILVTDEVKEDLITLVTSCGYESDYWIECCFSREEDGTTYDYDTYYDDLDIWYSAEDRIELRAELQNEENNMALYALYSYSDGEVAVVAESIVDTSLNSGVLIYNTADSLTATLYIEDISYVSEVTYDFYVQADAGDSVFLFESAQSATISEDVADIYDTLYESDYPYFYAYGDFILLECDYGPLYNISISDGVLESADIISDDAYVFAISDGVVYYTADTYTSSSYDEFGDVYSYDGESSTRLAQDVLTYYVTIYDDGSLLVYSDISYGYYDDEEEYELTMISAKGEKTVIDDEVTYYVRVDSDTLLYIADDNLYYYDGDESVLVEYDVDYFWSLNSLSYIRSY